MYIDIDLSLILGKLLTMDSERIWPEAKRNSQKRWKERQKAGKESSKKRWEERQEASRQRKEAGGQRQEAIH